MAPTPAAPVSTTIVDPGPALAAPTPEPAGPCLPASPQASTDAFGHYAEETCDPGIEAKKQLDAFDTLPAAEKTNALGAMTPEQVTQLAQDLPEEERARLVELAKLSPNPDAKLALFMAGQQAKVKADAGADLDDEMDAETAAKMEERRQKIAAETLEEMKREEAILREKGKALTPDEVNEMIARKTREHDLEMKHNVNLTADEHVRKDGVLAGKRVVWTEEELKVMESALAQAPTMKNGDNVDLETFHRSEDIGNNADHDPETKMIRIADAAIKDEKTRFIDPSGKPGDSTMDRDPSGDPDIEAKYGKRVSFMEWVVLHELGHNVHDFHENDAYRKYKNGMMIHDLDKEQLDARVPEEVSKDLEHGAKEVEHNGYVYVKTKDGFKCFPRAVFDGGADSEGNFPNPDPQEYFAQHYNQAILAPEETAAEYLDRPQKLEADTKKKLQDAKDARAKAAAEGKDTSAFDRNVEELEEARRHATAQRKVWEKSYDTMRNDVFHTADAETDARIRLSEAGVDTAEFDERAARLSTPDQIARLEAELLERDGLTP